MTKRAVDRLGSNAAMSQRSSGEQGLRVTLAAQQITALSRRAALAFALDVGRIVIECLYSGELGHWRERGKKEASLRQLASHPALGISATTLYRSLALYELCCRLDRFEWKRVGVSHLRAVLAAPEHRQAVLLNRAELEAWSSGRLEREVAAAESEVAPPSSSRSRGGRPRSPEYVKSIRRMHQLTNPESLEGLDHVDELDPERAGELLTVVSDIRSRLSIIEHALGRPSRLATRGVY